MSRPTCDLTIQLDETRSKKCGRPAVFFFAGHDVYGRLKVLIRCQGCGDVKRHRVLGEPPNPKLRFRLIPASHARILLDIAEITNTTTVRELSGTPSGAHKWRRIQATSKKNAHYRCERCDHIEIGWGRPLDTITYKDPVTGVRRTCDEEIVASVMES